MEYQSLMRRASQRELLDRNGDHAPLVAAVAAQWRTLASLRAERDAAQATARDRTTRLEMLRFHLAELASLDLKSEEIEELTAERMRLSQRGRLAEGARAIVQLLREAEDASAEQAVSRALSIARTLTDLDAQFAPMTRFIDESLIALREGVESVERYESSLDADPGRQEWVEQRLAAIEGLARKHRVEPAELIATRENLDLELSRLEALDASLESIETKLLEAEKAFRSACSKLSAARKSAAAELSERITALMQSLGMPGGKFQAAVSSLPPESAGQHGADDIEFLVSANPGQPPRPLAKVASGGELSRISLAVQVAAAQTDTLPCLVFDEVDAGVGGGVAEIVGRQLRTLGSRTQVLCVTHLPQVASQAHGHVRVAKLTDGKTTRTSLHPLTDNERTEEIARMLGGVDITAQARAHAAEMLQAARTTEEKPKASRASRRSKN